MIISTKGRYALRLMIDIAVNGNGGFIPLRDIAERQGISEKYLESIVVLLSRANYLEALRGKGGGYRLAREPKDYTVGGILKLAEGSLAPVSCLGEGAEPCRRASDCPTLPIWAELDGIIDKYLESRTLESLLPAQNNDASR